MEIWNTLKRNSMYIMGIPEKEDKEKKTECIFKALMAENFPGLGEKLFRFITPKGL